MNTELLTATNIIVAITCLVSFTLMDNRAGEFEVDVSSRND